MYNFAKTAWKRSEKVKCTLAVALFLLGLALRAVPGVSFSATLCWLLAAACVALTVLSRLARRHRVWRDLLYLARAGLAILLVVLAGIEVWVIHVGQRTPDESRPVDAVIVLGAGVNGTTPSMALRTRMCLRCSPGDRGRGRTSPRPRPCTTPSRRRASPRTG